MPFIKFNVIFTEDDYEKKESLGLKATTEKGEININTNMVCAYNKMDNGHVLVRMASGECYELPVDIDFYNKIIEDSEVILEIEKNLNEN